MFDPIQPHRPAIFLDRDGVLIEEVHYLSSVEQVRLLPGVVEGLRLLERSGFELVVVTNQAGVARHFFPESQVRVIHDHLEDLLASQGIGIRDWKYCPHHPTEGIGEYKVDCLCRKPKPGMLLEAAAEHGINLKASFLIGDKRSDLEAGAAAGCRTTLVRTGHGSSEERNLLPGLPGFLGICDTLAEAARLVLRAPQRESFSNIPVRAWA
ncbi:MAG: HAD family hydrolase [Planctomycetota bacterium]|nr:HAD family hydrolase [Planctomycetota bacterium]